MIFYKVSRVVSGQSHTNTIYFIGKITTGDTIYFTGGGAIQRARRGGHRDDRDLL